jgi:predicted nucleic acid-binding protein
MTLAGDHPAISDLTWLECRVRPIRMSDPVALANMEAFLSGSDVARVPMPTAVYERACRIRAVHNFQLADSLHLAAAVESGCGLFLTNDHRLSSFPDLPVEVSP